MFVDASPLLGVFGIAGVACAVSGTNTCECLHPIVSVAPCVRIVCQDLDRTCGCLSFRLLFVDYVVGVGQQKSSY